MNKRRKAREFALQALYSLELNEKSLDDLFEDSFFQTMADRHKEFTRTLTQGCLEHRAILDQHIERFSQNWKINRIAVLDRILLRLALFEMAYYDETPDVVAINESIELAKKFSTEESGAFINGILDNFRKHKEESFLEKDDDDR